MAEPATKKRRLSPNGKGGASVPGFANWDLEQDYENRQARKKKKEKKQDKLMIKTAEGRVVENPRVEEQKEQEDGEDDEDRFMASDDGEDGDSGVADLHPSQTPQKPQIPAKEQIRQAMEDLARIAQSLSENPEDHIGQLGTLADIANSQNATVKQLALKTQLSVFKDIIPGYRIRPLSEADLTGKVSKDVKKLRTFEQGLLSGYKTYQSNLSSLAVLKPNAKDPKAAKAVASVAIFCACELLINIPHFNNRGDLIGILVRKLASRHVDADFVKCRESIEQLFRDDEEGHASLDVVTQLTKMMKGKKYAIHESVLNTFLHLRLLSEFAHKAAPNRVDKDEPEQTNGAKKQKQKREFRTKKERKLLRERKEVEKEMKVADAAVSYEERDKNQAETLKLVFVAYFRILKERIQHLMGAVLEGLAKYSHLINQDFFGDVLEALKDLINEAEAALQPDEDETEDEIDVEQAMQRNATRESLLCIITAFALLQGQIDVVKSANALSLDLSFFIRHLYRTLIPLSMDQDIELSAKTTHLDDPNGLQVPSTTSKDTKVNVATTTVLLLRSLQSVLLPPTNTKSVPPVRVAAFVKQLETLALQLPQKSAIAVLELLRSVTKTHSSRVAALWHTEERKGDGVFDPLSQEAEQSNPFASTVWEGELLRLHWDPKVRDAVKGIEGNVKQGR
ncbi:Nucleolar complex-associated 3 [Lecanosticta acicola]|uniref:Nucleolar complex-associated protein 3 n=1 Tax=Lecanosticta acicola TaxID=111012 RepID=A0AAI8Z139_9PEZI|nr:Nucleolar complex-associated 3 [Lecanosticta acicola]